MSLYCDDGKAHDYGPYDYYGFTECRKKCGSRLNQDDFAYPYENE